MPQRFFSQRFHTLVYEDTMIHEMLLGGEFCVSYRYKGEVHFENIPSQDVMNRTAHQLVDGHFLYENDLVVDETRLLYVVLWETSSTDLNSFFLRCINDSNVTELSFSDIDDNFLASLNYCGTLLRNGQ